MDPDVTWAMIQDPSTHETTRLCLAMDLEDWLHRGGFPPVGIEPSVAMNTVTQVIRHRGRTI